MARSGALRVALLLLLAAGCSERPAAPQGEPQRGAPPPIVLVSLDTLRADALTPYGYALPTSPVLERFAREAVRFADAHANATATLPSHLSLLSSLYPAQLGITRADGENDNQARTRLRLADGVLTLAEALRAHGYQTLAFSDGGFVHPYYGFDQGFERFEVATGPGLYWNQLRRTTHRLADALAARDARGESARRSSCSCTATTSTSPTVPRARSSAPSARAATPSSSGRTASRRAPRWCHAGAARCRRVTSPGSADSTTTACARRTPRSGVSSACCAGTGSTTRR